MALSTLTLCASTESARPLALCRSTRREVRARGGDADASSAEFLLDGTEEGKRHPRDFALWKGGDGAGASWPSSWGGPARAGRPGWHIECSAMAAVTTAALLSQEEDAAAVSATAAVPTAALLSQEEQEEGSALSGGRPVVSATDPVDGGTWTFSPALDVHSGGCDLRFPHHVNEVLQCEAFFTPSPSDNSSATTTASSSSSSLASSSPSPPGVEPLHWPRYFLHTGHLHIRGRKMSKSLKNFLTMQDVREDHGCTAEHFRLFCLSARYRSHVEFSPDRLRDAAELSRRLRSFFRAIRASDTSHLDNISSSASSSSHPLPYILPTATTSRSFFRRIQQRHNAMLDHLADDFDTPAALEQLLGLVGDVQSALSKSPSQVSAEVLHHSGTVAQEFLDACGFDVPRAFLSTNDSAEEKASLHGIVDAAVNLRAEVRSVARELRDSRLFAACDTARDALKVAGIDVQDHHNRPDWAFSTQHNE